MGKLETLIRIAKYAAVGGALFNLIGCAYMKEQGREWKKVVYKVRDVPSGIIGSRREWKEVGEQATRLPYELRERFVWDKETASYLWGEE